MRVWARWTQSRARRVGHGVEVLGGLGRAALDRSSLPRPAGRDPGGRPDPARVVVLGTAFIGDLVLATPLLCVLRGAFPAAHITLVAPERVADLLAGSPVHDRFVPLAATDRRGLAASAGSLRAQSPDLAVILPHTVEAALFAYATGAPVRVGHSSQGRSFLLTRTAPNAKTVHEVDRQLGLAHALGVDVLDAPPPRVWPAPAQRESAVRRLAGLPPGGPLVAVALGAGSPLRRWRPDRWAEVVAGLVEARGARVVLLGGPEEHAPAREVGERLAAAGGPDDTLGRRCLDLVGHLSLGEVAWLLDAVDLLVGSDSGLLHLAAARGTPVVGLYGPGDPVAWGPFGKGHAVVRIPMACSPCANHTCSSVACLGELAAERVLGDVVRVMDGRARA